MRKAIAAAFATLLLVTACSEKQDDVKIDVPDKVKIDEKGGSVKY